MRKIIKGLGRTQLLLIFKIAYQLGKLIAQQGWVLLTGGRNIGVMNVASQGTKKSDGLTIGVFPSNK